MSEFPKESKGWIREHLPIVLATLLGAVISPVIAYWLNQEPEAAIGKRKAEAENHAPQKKPEPEVRRPKPGGPPPEPTPEPGVPFSLTGRWAMNYSSDYFVSSNGQKTKRRRTESNDVDVELTEEAGQIRGKFIFTTDGGCTDARISGTKNGNTFVLEVNYFGSCCPGLLARMKGTLASSSSFTATEEPVNRPPRSCRASFARITALKTG